MTRWCPRFRDSAEVEAYLEGERLRYQHLLPPRAPDDADEEEDAMADETCAVRGCDRAPWEGSPERFCKPCHIVNHGGAQAYVHVVMDSALRLCNEKEALEDKLAAFATQVDDARENAEEIRWEAEERGRQIDAAHEILDLLGAPRMVGKLGGEARLTLHGRIDALRDRLIDRGTAHRDARAALARVENECGKRFPLVEAQLDRLSTEAQLEFARMSREIEWAMAAAFRRGRGF